MVGGRRPWRECAYVRTWYILHTFFWLFTRATKVGKIVNLAVVVVTQLIVEIGEPLFKVKYTD